MNGLCRGKENNVGLNRWKNEWVLQREGEQCRVKQMEERMGFEERRRKMLS